MAETHDLFVQTLAATGDHIAALKAVRLKFGLDPRQAKEVMLQAEGTASSLDEHEEGIALALEQAIVGQRKGERDSECSHSTGGARVADPVLESIARTRHRPAVYIGTHSAEAMFLYLAGYTGALRDHTNIDLTLYSEFIDSLYAKYGRGGGGHSWAQVLGERTGSDEAALDCFFVELEAFLKVKA